MLYAAVGILNSASSRHGPLLVEQRVLHLVQPPEPLVPQGLDRQALPTQPEPVEGRSQEGTGGRRPDALAGEARIDDVADESVRP